MNAVCAKVAKPVPNLVILEESLQGIKKAPRFARLSVEPSGEISNYFVEEIQALADLTFDQSYNK